MPIFKRLIQTPSSPEKSLKALTGTDKYKGATFARLADVNELSKDVMDIKHYEIDLDGAASGTFPISSKKGILDIENADATSTSLNLYLQNSEIIADRTKFYVQFSVYTTNVDVTPIVVGRGISSDIFHIEILNLSPAAAWDNLYVYYELIQID